MNNSARIQSVRNAWINALRAEVLRVHTLDIAKVAAIGIWIATFADADGTNAYPSAQTLAALAGCSQETVTRAVRVLVAVDMLARRRRPNASTMYQLLMPLGRPDWAAHMHLFTRTRQRAAYAKNKRAATTSDQPRTPTADAHRTPSVSGVPDPVHGRTPNHPDPVNGRDRNPSTDALRTPSTDAPTTTHLPTVGTHSHDQEMADHLPQVQVRAREQPTEPTGIDAFRAARHARRTPPPNTQPA